MKANRVALWVWYRGEFFRGFQSQVEGPTVQQSLGGYLATIGAAAPLFPSGRTDKGVHARMQVLSLRLRGLTLDDLQLRLCSRPFPGLGICSARPAPKGFHAQWSCGAKEYRYRLRLQSCPPGWENYSWAPIDDPRLRGHTFEVERVAEALRHLVGTHDFCAFHHASSARRPRSVLKAELVDLGAGLLEVRIVGDRFGRYQVRFMVGAAVAVGTGTLTMRAFIDAIDGQRIDGIRAPAQGLILWEAHYPRALDPFAESERASALGVPSEPPFSTSAASC
jgi:tRNA pseudouridine38-40 synthase